MARKCVRGVSVENQLRIELKVNIWEFEDVCHRKEFPKVCWWLIQDGTEKETRQPETEKAWIFMSVWTQTLQYTDAPATKLVCILSCAPNAIIGVITHK